MPWNRSFDLTLSSLFIPTAGNRVFVAWSTWHLIMSLFAVSHSLSITFLIDLLMSEFCFFDMSSYYPLVLYFILRILVFCLNDIFRLFNNLCWCLSVIGYSIQNVYDICWVELRVCWIKTTYFCYPIISQLSITSALMYSHFVQYEISFIIRN